MSTPFKMAAVSEMTNTVQGMSFKLNFPKSTLMLLQTLVWMNMGCDIPAENLRLSLNGYCKIQWKLFLMLMSDTFTRQQWESLLRYLNFAVEFILQE